MKKIIIKSIALMLLALVLFTSCESGSDELATISFSINTDRARTVSSGAENVKITQYVFTLTTTKKDSSSDKEEAETSTFTFPKSSDGVYTISGIMPGQYNIKVEGKTSNNTVIAQDSLDYFFVRGVNSTITLSLSSLIGSQVVELTYSWTPSSYKTNPVFTLQVVDQNRNNVTIAADSITQGEGTATFRQSLPAGSYIFIARLCKTATSLIIYNGHTEVIRTTNSNTVLSQSFSFNDASTVTNSVSINSSISEPITATLNGTVSGDNAVLSVTYSDLPDGITKDDIYVMWYEEDYLLKATEKGAVQYSFAKKTALGKCRYTAVMICDKIGAMGSASAIFNFIN